MRRLGSRCDPCLAARGAIATIMSRFVNLEFGSESDDRSQNESELKDERHYFADAMRAFEEGQFEQALRAFAKVLEFNPQNARAWSGQVRMLIELGEFHEAKVWADKALERFPRDSELLAAKAVALGRAGDLKAALAFSDASIEEHGDTPYIWLARGDVLMARNEKRADYCFEKAHLLAPHDWFIHWLASRIRFYYEKFALALKLVQQALTFDATQAVVWLQLGKCQQALGMIAPAEMSFQQALQLDSRCREAEHALAAVQHVGWFGSLRAKLNGLFSR
jgi:tetratricopeptide (TPR) repeat protein